MIALALLAALSLPEQGSSEECRYNVVVACEDRTLRSRDGGECDDDKLQKEFSVCLPLALRVPLLENLDSLLHVACENLVYGIVSPSAPDDSETPLGEAFATQLCRWW